MPGKRPLEPIAPATIPGQPLDPKIPPDQMPEDDEGRGEPVESEEERQACDSQSAFERAISRVSPD